MNDQRQPDPALIRHIANQVGRVLNGYNQPEVMSAIGYCVAMVITSIEKLPGISNEDILNTLISQVKELLPLLAAEIAEIDRLEHELVEKAVNNQ